MYLPALKTHDFPPSGSNIQYCIYIAFIVQDN